jgi:type IV secretion system protein VirB10
MMFARRGKNEPIDAAAELERREQERIEGERGASELGAQQRQSPPGAKTFLAVLVVAIGALGVAFTIKAMQMREAEPTETQQSTLVRNTLPELKPAPPAPPPQPPQPPSQPVPAIQPVQASIAAPAPMAGSQKPAEPSPAELLRQRRLQAGLAVPTQANSSAGGPSNAMAMPPDTAPARAGDLQQRLQPMRLNPSFAGTLPDRDMLLTQGTMIDCALETKIVSTVPGMVSCHLTRDVYSTNRRVVLLDRGSKVVGFYQGGLTQGKARIFVNWSRVETPQGVIINLDSPGTGPLGEGGLGGYMETHFWERFGGAIMLSLIDDFAARDHAATRHQR